MQRDQLLVRSYLIVLRFAKRLDNERSGGGAHLCDAGVTGGGARSLCHLVRKINDHMERVTPTRPIVAKVTASKLSLWASANRVILPNVVRIDTISKLDKPT